MAVQTADLQLLGVDHSEELSLYSSLMNIARGNCNIQVKQNNDRLIGSIGWLKILIDRPIMTGEIFLEKNNFRKIFDAFKYSVSRPVTLVVILDQELMLNSVGDLILSETKSLKIVDISWIIPLT
jgi:hypothetical protein